MTCYERNDGGGGGGGGTGTVQTSMSQWPTMGFSIAHRYLKAKNI